MQRSEAPPSKNKLEGLWPLLDLRVSTEVVLSGGLLLARTAWHLHTDPAAAALRFISASHFASCLLGPRLAAVRPEFPRCYTSEMSILRTSEASGDAKIPEIKRVGTLRTAAPRRPSSATLNQFVSLPNEQRRGRDMNCINK